MKEDTRIPSVLIPYPGACRKQDCNDVFVYLRPETNGVEVESTILRVVRNNPQYRNEIQLVYLANIPGDFIVRNKIIEDYLSCQLYFAVGGKDRFTEHMKNVFESYFRKSLNQAEVVSPFRAMELFSMTPDELFSLRVPMRDMLLINGQSIKKYQNVFIINYDIPGILHKNNNKTDIAAMVFRTTLKYSVIHNLIDDMGKALLKAGILHPKKPLSRIFHYSKGPFDQIKDAIGHLYRFGNEHVPISEISFAAYLIEKGFSETEILGTIRNPIIQIEARTGQRIENNLFSYTANDSFELAEKKLYRVCCLLLLDRTLVFF